MNKQNTQSLLGACLAVILGAGSAGFASAQTALDSVQVQGELETIPTQYRGVIDRIPSGGRSLIIDDTLLSLDNVVQMNGESWSGASVAGRLKEGMVIEFVLKQGPGGPLPIIVDLSISR